MIYWNRNPMNLRCCLKASCCLLIHEERSPPVAVTWQIFQKKLQQYFLTNLSKTPTVFFDKLAKKTPTVSFDKFNKNSNIFFLTKLPKNANSIFWQIYQNSNSIFWQICQKTTTLFVLTNLPKNANIIFFNKFAKKRQQYFLTNLPNPNLFFGAVEKIPP